MRRPLLPLLAAIMMTAGCAGLKPVAQTGLQVLPVPGKGATTPTATSNSGSLSAASTSGGANPTSGNSQSTTGTPQASSGGSGGGSRGGGSSGGGRQSRGTPDAPSSGGSLDTLITNFSLVKNPRLEPSRKSFEATADALVKAGLISDNGGGLIGNNGGNLIGNNGSGMIGNNAASYRVGRYHVAGTGPIGDLQLYWDSRTHEIRRLTGAWGQLLLSVLDQGDTQVVQGELRDGPDGATGRVSVAITGTWQVLLAVWEALLRPVTTEPCYLADGKLPMEVTSVQAELALKPKNDPALAMGASLLLEYGVKKAGLLNLTQAPAHIALSLDFPGMTFEWESTPGDPEATGVDALEANTRGALIVETDAGPDRLDYVLDTEVDPDTKETTAMLTLANERSGLGMDPAERSGEKALARLSTLEDDTAVGMVAVGEAEVSPLQVKLEDGSVKPWEIFPVEWLGYLPEGVTLPAGLFPVATPAPPPPATDAPL